MGANPLKKDLFVEMDYMPGLLASEEELDRITEIFANMPIRNPNGTTGINIHLDAGSARSAKYNLGGGNEVPYQQLDSTMEKWHEIRRANMDPDRGSSFHYMIWGDAHDEYGSSGLGYIGAPGFVVTVLALLGQVGNLRRARGDLRARAGSQPRLASRWYRGCELQAELHEHHELPLPA